VKYAAKIDSGNTVVTVAVVPPAAADAAIHMASIGAAGNWGPAGETRPTVGRGQAWQGETPWLSGPAGIVTGMSGRANFSATHEMINIATSLRGPVPLVNGIFPGNAGNPLPSNALRLLVTPALDSLGYLTRIPTTGEPWIDASDVEQEWPANASYVMLFDKGPLTSAQREALAGEYVFRWEGTQAFSLGGSAVTNQDTSVSGQITFDWMVPGSGTFFTITLSGIDTENYPKNFRIMRTTEVAAYDGGERYNAQMRDDLRSIPVTALRMMDLSATNNSTQVEWANRVKVNQFSGRLAWEDIIGFANSIPVPIWINVPHMADDDYIASLAEMLRDSVAPNLPIYVEYSNEWWNTNFSQTSWLAQQAIAEWGIDSFAAGQNYGTKKAVNMANIFKSVFTGDDRDRLKLVMAGQAANPSNFNNYLLKASLWKTQEPDEWEDPLEVFDILSVSNYVGASFLQGSSRTAFADALGSTPEEADFLAAEQVLVDFMTGTNVSGDNPSGTNYLLSARTQWAEFKVIAGEKDVAAYEGGLHIWHSFGVTPMTPQMLAFAFWWESRQSFVEINEQAIANWTQVFGAVGFPSQFVLYGSKTIFGFWSLLEHPGASHASQPMALWKNVLGDPAPWPYDPEE